MPPAECQTGAKKPNSRLDWSSQALALDDQWWLQILRSPVFVQELAGGRRQFATRPENELRGAPARCG